VINATGVWVDAVRDMDRDEGSRPVPPMVAPSQGVHLVVDRAFLPGNHALLVPKTEDGRVLFAVPWLGKTILGTTDTPREDLAREPTAFAAGRRLHPAGGRRAIWPGRRSAAMCARSGWACARWSGRPAMGLPTTKAISREHTVIVGRSGLVTVTGGKWTTYRSMAEDVLEQAMAAGLLPRRAGGVTVRLPLLGAAPGRPLSEPAGEHLYGSEVALLRSLPGADTLAVARSGIRAPAA
jgi:glycerol-3-phosphate dehydrogenase